MSFTLMQLFIVFRPMDQNWWAALKTGSLSSMDAYFTAMTT
jgi:hypothetical protein